MKRVYGVVLFLSCAFLMVGTADAWQGRMAGMDDPYGLIQDESDFLIHPGRIAEGEGSRFYGHYNFLYTVDSEWTWDMDLVNIPLIGSVSASYNLDMDGNVHSHDVLTGMTFPLGSGRIGLFFEFDGQYGNYDGESRIQAAAPPGSLSVDFDDEVETCLSDFAVRAVYGVPLGNAHLGFELKIAYRMEQNTFENELTDLSGISLPGDISLTLENFPITGLTHFLLPYDSDYWDLSIKPGIGWEVGGVEFDLTARGGMIFFGDNTWDSDIDFKLSNGGVLTVDNDFDMDGDVDGYNFGLDFWIRFPVSDSTSVPIVFGVDYRETERDGEADDGALTFAINPPGIDSSTALTWNHEMEETLLDIHAGFGFDIDSSPESKIALGLYYNYLQSQRDLNMEIGIPDGGISVMTESDGFPESREHRLTFKFAGEHGALSFPLRWGFHLFYGMVDEEYDDDIGLTAPISLSGIPLYDVSLDGNHWGGDAALGSTIEFDAFAIEPFIQGGYHDMNLDGDASLVSALANFDVDKEMTEWFLGVGFSILFNL